MAKTNRSLRAKFERSKRERMELGKIEGAKPFYSTWRDGAGISRAEVTAMVTSFKGEITKVPSGKLAKSIGKGRRTLDTSTGGNFKRLKMGVSWDSFGNEDAILPATLARI